MPKGQYQKPPPPRRQIPLPPHPLEADPLCDQTERDIILPPPQRTDSVKTMICEWLEMTFPCQLVIPAMTTC